MGKKSKANNNKQANSTNNTNGNSKQKKTISKSESKVEENTFTEEQLKIHRENVVKLTKDLAATDEGFRTRATERFPKFLKEAKFNKLDLDTNFIDFRKLWKGALYGFWLCDGEFKQHEMAQLLAECIHQVKGSESSNELPIAFLRAFFDELFETWPRLDKHRMDKYLMLVRKVMQQAFVFLNKTAQYKPEAVEEFIEFILEDGIFNNEERKLLASLQIHIAELFFLELVQYGGPQVENDSDYHLNEDALMKFIQFFIKDFASTENNSIKKTYKEEMFDLLTQYQSVEGESKPEEEEETAEEDEENGDAMEDEDDDDEDLPLDEFGNVRQIVKDRALPVNIERIVKEFEKYKTGYENSDVCVEYYEKFKTRIITLDDLYSELEEVETTVSKKEQAKIEKKKKQQEKKEQATENKKPQEKKQTEKVEETTPQEKKQQPEKKQKKENNKAAEQKKKEEEEKKKQEKLAQEKLEQERLAQEKQAQLEKEQKEREAAAEEKKRSQLLSKVKSVKKLLKEKKPTTSTASSEEKQEKKKVIIDLEKNQVKTFNKKDIVPSLPVDLTFSPTKGLLKTKQDKKRSSDSSDNSQRSSKKRK